MSKLVHVTNYGLKFFSSEVEMLSKELNDHNAKTFLFDEIAAAYESSWAEYASHFDASLQNGRKLLSTYLSKYFDEKINL